MGPKQSDPVVDEIREVRRRISQQVNHHPQKLVAHYLEVQKQYRERLLQTNEGRDRKNAL
jgi:hypothetical protein